MADALAALQLSVPWLLPAYAFVVGTVCGSFLNVVIARVPAGLSVVSPPSRCPRCESRIAWYDNVPVISWLLLRARCRKCGLPISARYPVVELLCGVLALAVERRFGPSLTSIGFFAFAGALVALSYIDLDTWLLPHEITWPLLGVGLLSPLWNPALRFLESAAGAGVGVALFGGIALFGERVLKRETMGWGDVWLLGGIGAWLGVQWMLPVILLASLQGALVGLLLIAVGRDPAKKAQDEAEQRKAAPDGAGRAVVPARSDEDVAIIDQTPQPAAHSPQPAASATSSVEDDWVPPKHAVPFGPFLALAALEVLLAGPALLLLWDRLTGGRMGA